MYRVVTATAFEASHALTVPDAGPENESHTHEYGLELEVAGPSLDDHDYLVDVDDLRGAVEAFADRHRGRMLNDLPGFEGHNPSIERLARLACERFRERLPTDRLDRITVTVHEDDVASAACTVEC